MAQRYSQVLIFFSYQFYLALPEIYGKIYTCSGREGFDEKSLSPRCYVYRPWGPKQQGPIR